MVATRLCMARSIWGPTIVACLSPARRGKVFAWSTASAASFAWARVCPAPGDSIRPSSASAYALGHRVAAVTKIADKDMDRLEQFTIPKEDIYCLPSERSTDMVNIYHAEQGLVTLCNDAAPVDANMTYYAYPQGVEVKIAPAAARVRPSAFLQSSPSQSGSPAVHESIG